MKRGRRLRPCFSDRRKLFTESSPPFGVGRPLVVRLLRLERVDCRRELDHRLRRAPHAFEMGLKPRRSGRVSDHDQIVVLRAFTTRAEVRRSTVQDRPGLPAQSPGRHGALRGQHGGRGLHARGQSGARRHRCRERRRSPRIRLRSRVDGSSRRPRPDQIAGRSRSGARGQRRRDVERSAPRIGSGAPSSSPTTRDSSASATTLSAGFTPSASSTSSFPPTTGNATPSKSRGACSGGSIVSSRRSSSRPARNARPNSEPVSIASSNGELDTRPSTGFSSAFSPTSTNSCACSSDRRFLSTPTRPKTTFAPA